MRLNLKLRAVLAARTLLTGIVAICVLPGFAAAEPGAFSIPDTEPIAVPLGGQAEIMIVASGAGTAYGMSLFLEVAPPFRIDDLIVDQAGSGTVWVGNSTGASVYTSAGNPSAIPSPQYAVGYVTVPGNPISIAHGAIVAKVLVSFPAATPAGTQGSLTTNSPAMACASDWAGVSAMQDVAVLEATCVEHAALDLDQDCDVDGDDLEVFEDCASGPAVLHDGTTTCLQADIDADDDVDQSDFAIFQRCFSGEDAWADPGCAN
jgi:hypothetical protein